MDTSRSSNVEWLSLSAIHDIRSPLAIVKGFWELGSDKAFNQRHQEIITRNLNEMTQMVDSLLALHSMRPYQALDMGRLVRQICDDYSETCETRQLRLSLSGEPFTVSGDALALRQCLRVLLDNAVEVTPRGGDIRIALQIQCDFGIISVHDTGPGIPETLRDRLFEPGFTTKTHGHGLGLAIGRQVLRQHQGDLRLGESQAGSLFSMWLPLLEDHDEPFTGDLARRPRPSGRGGRVSR